MARMNNDSYALSLAGMLTALSLLFIYLAGILPTARLSMYALASLLPISLCMEQRTAYAILMYFAVGGISLLILPNVLVVVPYILFFGYYGITKHHIERIKDKFLAIVLKLAVFNVGLALIYFLSKTFLLTTIPDVLKNNFWLFIILAQVVFMAYDFLYSKLAEYYDRRLRKFLMTRGRR